MLLSNAGIMYQVCFVSGNVHRYMLHNHNYSNLFVCVTVQSLSILLLSLKEWYVNTVFSCINFKV